MKPQRSLRFSRFGVFYVLFALGVGAAAINTGNNLLYLILGIFLGLIIVSGILSDSSLWGIRTAWQPLDDLYAGRRSRWACTVSKGKFSGFLVHIDAFWNAAAPSAMEVPWIPSHQERTRLLEVTPLRRGRLRLERVQASTLFPFGFFQKRHLENREESWIVFPKVNSLSLADFQDEKPGPRHDVPRVGTGAIPFSLRDYRPGDPARRIHWKASERTGRWTVHEMEAEADRAQTLWVRAWPIERPEQEREDFLSFIASYCVASEQALAPIGLRTPDFELLPGSGPAHLQRLLRYLALVDFSSTDNRPRREAHPTDAASDALALWRKHRGR